MLPISERYRAVFPPEPPAGDGVFTRLPRFTCCGLLRSVGSGEESVSATAGKSRVPPEEPTKGALKSVLERALAPNVAKESRPSRGAHGVARLAVSVCGVNREAADAC